jgi:hypothetical protein
MRIHRVCVSHFGQGIPLVRTTPEFSRWSATVPFMNVVVPLVRLAEEDGLPLCIWQAAPRPAVGRASRHLLAESGRPMVRAVVHAGADAVQGRFPSCVRIARAGQHVHVVDWRRPLPSRVFTVSPVSGQAISLLAFCRR